MAKKLAYFKAFASYQENIKPLSDDEKGRLFSALLEYTETGNAPTLTGNERFVFPGIKAQIDRDGEAYKTKCERLSENAKKRYKKAADTDEDMQLHANAGKDKVKVKVKEKNKEKDTITYTDTPTPAQIPPPTFDEIAEYCKLKKLRVNPKRFFDYYDKREWHTSEGKPIDDWYSLIENWDKTQKDKKGSKESSSSFETDDFFEAALKRSYGEMKVD